MSITDEFKSILKIVTDGKELNYHQSKNAFQMIMSGNATDAQISSFLTAIKMQNITLLLLHLEQKFSERSV